jgi:hypothetical protein
MNQVTAAAAMTRPSEMPVFSTTESIVMRPWPRSVCVGDVPD